VTEEKEKDKNVGGIVDMDLLFEINYNTVNDPA